MSDGNNDSETENPQQNDEATDEEPPYEPRNTFDPTATLALTDQPVTYKTLQRLINTPTVPQRYRESPTGVDDMVAAVLVGTELGLGPMQSINDLYLVNGQVSMTGKLM